MAGTPNPPKVKAGTLAVAALAACCGVKLALLAAAGALTAGVLGRSVAVFGLGALALVGVFFAIGRRRVKGEAGCLPLGPGELEVGNTDVVSGPGKGLDCKADAPLSDSAPSNR